MTERFNPRLHHIRECRTLLLDFLNSVYPGAMAEDDLVDVLLDLPEPIHEDHAMRDLGYLAARRLIERAVEAHPVRRGKTVRWSLTAHGVTFIERGYPWAELEGAG